MEPIKVTVELGPDSVVSQRYVGHGSVEDGPEYEPVTFAEAIVDAAWRGLLGQADGEAIRGLERRAREVADEVLRERVQQLVLEALEAIVPTLSLGGAVEGRTLHQHVVDVARRELERKDHHGGRGGTTLLERVIREEVGKAFQAELVAEITAAKAAARQVVTEQAAQVIVETIERAGRA